MNRRDLLLLLGLSTLAGATGAGTARRDRSGASDIHS